MELLSLVCAVKHPRATGTTRHAPKRSLRTRWSILLRRRLPLTDRPIAAAGFRGVTFDHDVRGEGAAADLAHPASAGDRHDRGSGARRYTRQPAHFRRRSVGAIDHRIHASSGLASVVRPVHGRSCRRRTVSAGRVPPSKQPRHPRTPTSSCTRARSSTGVGRFLPPVLVPRRIRRVPTIPARSATRGRQRVRVGRSKRCGPRMKRATLVAGRGECASQ